MKSAVKKIVPMAWRAWWRTIRTVTRDYGHYRTIREGASLSPAGEPWPWISYGAIFYLERLDFSACKVLEFGSGGSTLYWSKRAREVISIETDRRWYDKVKDGLPSHVRLRHFGNEQWGECLKEVAASAPYDAIVIDGAWRAACADACVSLLMPTGMVILDNPDWYPKAHASMARHDLLEVSFSGLTPIFAWSTTTNVYLTRQFSIPLKRPFKFTDLPGSVPDNHEDR
jgi:hypothetical protein